MVDASLEKGNPQMRQKRKTSFESSVRRGAHRDDRVRGHEFARIATRESLHVLGTHGHRGGRVCNSLGDSRWRCGCETGALKKKQCRCYILITSIVTYVQSTHPPVSGAFGSSGFEPDLGFSPRHPSHTYGCRLLVYRFRLPSSIER